MRKRFVTNLLFLLVLNLLIKSFWILGVDRGVQNALPAEDYGIYFALLNFSYLFNIILDFGITNYNNRTIAQYPQLLNKYFSRIIPIKILLSSVYIILIFIIAIIAGYNPFSLKLLFWMSLSQVLSSLLLYLRSNISGLLMFKTDSILSVMDRFLMVVICSILLWTNFLKTPFKIEYFVYAQFISYLITTIIALIICIKKSSFIRLKFSLAFLIKIAKDSYPYALLVLLMAFYNRIDSVMIERILSSDGAEASSIYASAFRLVDAANMIAYLFSIILLPLFANLIKNRGELVPIIKISFHLLLLLTLGFAIISNFYSFEIMEILYNKHIDESAEVYKILSLCFMPIAMTYIFGTLLTANNSMKKLNIVAFFGMVLNIGINLFLIPRFQALGAAYSSLIAQSLTSILQIIIAIKLFNIRINPRYILKISLFIIFSIGFALIIKSIIHSWLLSSAGIISVIIILSIIFNIFNIKDLKSLIKTGIKPNSET